MNHNGFRPPPGLDNPHVQTVLGQLLTGARFCRPSRERHVRLADDDTIVLHDSVPFGWTPRDRVALLLHGLGGCATSPHCGRVGRRLLDAGLRVVRMDLRGSGRGAGLARRRYHGGISEDVRAAAAAIRHWAPEAPLVLIGFSLGGNIALKLAGEAADQPGPGLERVAVVGPPIDMARCSALLADPVNRIYNAYFVKVLMRQHEERRGLIPDLPKVEFSEKMTLRTWDERVVAPQWGFDGADDYYRRSSALPLIPNIQVPTLILTARDDPIIAVEPFEELKAPPHVEVRIERFGGHLGFVGLHPVGGLRWADQCLVQWVLRSSPVRT
ncbi:MAG TPA: alpha/beta fold hydrolase [Gemmataceae bacterium]|nr:alpha/beta fold hydrolase [Gemmataceae bacterium]